jgi:excisionase family DNA binding protein
MAGVTRTILGVFAGQAVNKSRTGRALLMFTHRCCRAPKGAYKSRRPTRDASPAARLLKGRMVTKQLYTVAEFCASHGIGKSTFYEEVRTGRLVIVKIGAATRVTREAASAWVAALPSANAAA